MRILLSAFSCAPNVGSEAGGGWMYAMRLAELGHRVWVLTDESRRPFIDAWGGGLPVGLTIEYYRPRLLRRVRLRSRTAHLIYQAWQMGAWRVARDLDREHDFDVCWHLTYGVFRQPSWMWKVGKPFVFGPVGGGERAPVRLWGGMPWREKLRELGRDAVNAASWHMPGLRATYRNARLVIARTEDTRAVLPMSVREKTAVEQEIGGYPARVRPDQRQGHGGALRILFAGRLLGWKGVHLAIPAYRRFIERGGEGRLTVIGEGPMKAHLQSLAADLGGVEFIDRLPQNQLFERYPEFDVLLFPSLHDSGGNVVIEALSFGLPVVCLDLGGPRCFVDDSCGHVVVTAGKSVGALIDDLATALLDIHAAPERHRELCRGALRRADAMTWEKQIDRVSALVEGCL